MRKKIETKLKSSSFSGRLLLLCAELGEAGAARLDGGLLVVLANLAGIHKGWQPGSTLGVVHVQREGLLDAILVVLHRLVVVGVVLGLRHLSLFVGLEKMKTKSRWNTCDKKQPLDLH